MRLYETQGGQFPDMRQFVTPELIDEIIRTGKWVDHGADLDDWLDHSMYASDNQHELGIDGEALENLPWEEQRHHPDFRKCIEHWVNQAAQQFQNILEKGDPYDKLAPFGPSTRLYRCMGIDDDLQWFGQSRPKFGIFWSAAANQAKRFITPGKTNVIMITSAKQVSIDWYQTFRSRIDYGNGSDEQEFQLTPGSAIGQVTYRRLDSQDWMTKSGVA